MFFRFGSAVVLAVAISVAGIALEKRSLEYRREISRQHYQLEVLRERRARLRIASQQLGAPTRMLDALERGEIKAEEASEPVARRRNRLPLLRWQRPLAD